MESTIWGKTLTKSRNCEFCWKNTAWKGHLMWQIDQIDWHGGWFNVTFSSSLSILSCFPRESQQLNELKAYTMNGILHQIGMFGMKLQNDHPIFTAFAAYRNQSSPISTYLSCRPWRCWTAPLLRHPCGPKGGWWRPGEMLVSPEQRVNAPKSRKVIANRKRSMWLTFMLWVQMYVYVYIYIYTYLDTYRVELVHPWKVTVRSCKMKVGSWKTIPSALQALHLFGGKALILDDSKHIAKVPESLIQCGLFMFIAFIYYVIIVFFMVKDTFWGMVPCCFLQGL